MKKHYYLIPLAVAALLGGCSKDSYDDTAIWSKVNSIDQRVTQLENTLSQMNKDISSINVIVNALQKNLTVTNVLELTTGFQITFSDGKTILVNNGKDGANGLTPSIGPNGNWWIGQQDTGVKAAGVDGKNGTDGQTPYIGNNGNWWIGQQDTGVKAAGVDGKNGTDGQTPYIGNNGNWWIGQKDTGVKATGIDGKNGSDGQTPYIGTNGNWWIGLQDTGVKAAGSDGKNGTNGQTPFIGNNGNWWIGQQDTGIKATGADGKNGTDGLTPYIGTNGNWWIGQQDTGVSASGTGSTNIYPNVPLISIEVDNGVYYWVQILNGNKSWLTDLQGDRIPVTGSGGVTPLIRIDVSGYWIISYDGGITYQRITNEYNQPVQAGNECTCEHFFQSVQVSNGYLVMVLIDGTVVRFALEGGGGNVTPTPKLPIDPNIVIPNPRFVVKYVPGRGYVLYIYVSGIKNPYTGEWLTYSDGKDGDTRNIYVEIDDEPWYIDLNDDKGEEKYKATDLVFLVDNSGSMSEEADYLAKFIIDWATYLTNKGIDARFGVVGFSVDGTINGAIQPTTAQVMSSFLNYSNRTGTSRTQGFLQGENLGVASKNYIVNDECGGLALRFANENMSFREEASRHYCIFTDEPNQPNNNYNYSINWFASKTNWPSNNGVVHVLYSGDDSFVEVSGQKEHYNVFYDYTGGYYQKVKTDFSDVNYADIDIIQSAGTGGIIYLDLDQSQLNNTHTVTLTYISADKTVVGQNSYIVEFNQQ